VWLIIAIVACALAGLALWEAASWRAAGLFIGALVVAFGVLHVTASAMIRGARSLPRFQSLMWRQAVSNLHRPGSQTRTVIVSLGVGVMVILALHLVERNLLWEIGENVPKDAPSYFFIDIQPDQHQAFARLLGEHGQQNVALTPLVRSRLSAINSEVIQSEGREKQEHGWYFTREYVLTFQQDLPKGNILLEGKWWDGEHDALRNVAELKVSVEEEAARHLGLKLGSSVEFDIQGTVVKATVASLRKVDWGNMSTNFYFIFPPGALAGAPMTYVATANVAPGEEVALQQAVVAAFPNVSAINIRDILDSVARVVDRISLVIRLMAVLAIVAGLIVLAGSLAANRYQRIYEAMILKSLGARRRTLAAIFLAEYSLLGAAAGLVGVFLATILAWGVVYWIFDLTWLFQPIAAAFGLVITVVITVTVGVLSTFRILGLKPLPVLRQE
jgi:putative ABC transport system permease protein